MSWFDSGLLWKRILVGGASGSWKRSRSREYGAMILHEGRIFVLMLVFSLLIHGAFLWRTPDRETLSAGSALSLNRTPASSISGVIRCLPAEDSEKVTATRPERVPSPSVASSAQKVLSPVIKPKKEETSPQSVSARTPVKKTQHFASQEHRISRAAAPSPVPISSKSVPEKASVPISRSTISPGREQKMSLPAPASAALSSEVASGTSVVQRRETPRRTAFGAVDGPGFLQAPVPLYPRIAQRRGIEGEVLLELTLGADGRLLDVSIVKNAGHGFDEAAVDAVRRARFRPAMHNGRPEACTVLLPVHFRLRNPS